MIRPAAPQAPESHARVPRAAGPEWQVLKPGQAQCSHVGGRPRVRCTTVATVELNRPRHRRKGVCDSWYACCQEHACGRWVEDGQVMQWVAIPVETAEVTL